VRRHPENREFYIRKTMGRTLRPYRYLGLMKQDRDNSHLAHEMVKCGKPACRCARNLRHRHGPYLYLRYEEYNRRTGRFGIDENMFPATELLRVRAWVRRFRTDRARGRAVLVFLRRYVAAREYRAGRRARIQSQHS
jgi:hypothetical protein